MPPPVRMHEDRALVSVFIALYAKYYQLKKNKIIVKKILRTKIGSEHVSRAERCRTEMATAGSKSRGEGARMHGELLIQCYCIVLAVPLGFSDVLRSFGTYNPPA